MAPSLAMQPHGNAMQLVTKCNQVFYSFQSKMVSVGLGDNQKSPPWADLLYQISSFHRQNICVPEENACTAGYY